MAKSSNSFLKKQRADKKSKLRKEKLQQKQEKKNTPKRSLEEMMAYVDENGNLSDTPPAEKTSTEE